MNIPIDQALLCVNCECIVDIDPESKGTRCIHYGSRGVVLLAILLSESKAWPHDVIITPLSETLAVKTDREKEK